MDEARLAHEIANLRLAFAYVGVSLWVIGLGLLLLPVPDEWPKRKPEQRGSDERERLFGRQVEGADGSRGQSGEREGDVPDELVAGPTPGQATGQESEHPEDA